MRINILFIIAVLFAVALNAQVSKTVNVTAGGLFTALTTNEKNTVTNLIIIGSIDRFHSIFTVLNSFYVRRGT